MAVFAGTACSPGTESAAHSPRCQVTTGAASGDHSLGSGDRYIADHGRGTGPSTAPASWVFMRGKPGRATLPRVTYPSFGINISAIQPAVPGKFAADATSPAAVLAVFMDQGNASLVGSALHTERPAIELRTITELYPTAPGVRPHIRHAGWIVIYQHIRLVSYGPRPFPRNTHGTFVAIMDAATGQWTNFFDYGGSGTGY